MASGSNAVPVSLTGTTGQVVNDGAGADQPPGILYGYYLEETGGASTVQIELRDGTATGAILGGARLAIGGSNNGAWFGPQGLRIPSGKIYVVIAGSGTAAGTVFLG